MSKKGKRSPRRPTVARGNGAKEKKAMAKRTKAWFSGMGEPQEFSIRRQLRLGAALRTRDEGFDDGPMLGELLRPNGG